MDKTLEYIKSGRGLPPMVGNSTEKRKNKVQFCEEYVLDELDRYKSRCGELENKIIELQNKIYDLTNIDEDEINNDENFDTFKVGDICGNYYTCHDESEWNWNKILKENNKTPDLVKSALENDESLKKLCSLKMNNGSYSDYGIGCVVVQTYNHKIISANKKIVVINATYNSLNVSEIDDRICFLSYEKALETIYKRVRRDCGCYLENYADKFYDEN